MADKESDYKEFELRKEMVLGYLGETEWLRLFDPLDKLRSKVEPRRGIYLFRLEPPACNIEIYKRLHNWVPQTYSQVTHIGGVKSKGSAVRGDIFKRAIKDYHSVRNRDVDVDRPSKYPPQRLEESRIMKQYDSGFYVKIFYTDSDEAEVHLLKQHVEQIGCKPPWEMR